MKKLFAILTSVLVAVLFVTSCNKIKDFGDINLSPNSPSTPYTTYLFTNAARYVPYFVLGSATNGYNVWQQAWPGYLSESKNNQYGPLGATTEFGVGTYYLYALKNLHYIIQMNEDPEQKDKTNVLGFGSTGNQLGVAKTLMAFYYMSISDILGPVVISEAFQGASDDNWTPKYETQQEAYTLLDSMLKEAYGQFEVNGALDASADVLYGGNIAKWKKFNATLRMLMAIKLSDVDPSTGKARFAAAYADGGMTDASDGFNFTYDDLNWNMMYYWCNSNYSGAGFCWVPNMFIVDQMKEFKDPRMFKYFDIDGYRGERDPELFPRDQYTSFYGVPFGLVDNAAVNAWVDCCASINKKMIAMDATVPVIPAARCLLTEAEAAYRGWISADAKALYEAGIKASFDWWGADGADAYIKSEPVAYKGGEEGLEQIALQRWIAGYLADGIEAWSDWRRLDIPKMPVGPGAIDKGYTHYPYRLAFSASADPVYNADNYALAIKDITGSDDTDGRVWWDVADNEEGVLSDAQCKPSVAKPAKWEVMLTGTMVYGYYYYSGEPLFESHESAIYKDVNHPGKYKIAPYGEGKELAMDLSETDNSFSYACQIVGTVNGAQVRAGDWDADQGTDHSGDPSYRGYFDEEEGAWLFMTIWRTQNAEGKWGLTAYGYDAFIPDAE
ncbi:MAG: SusD/RagB family nutrient-binding outer membrane lipoprotein [Bacteroidales bacterium]|nr:SusD/RagB family nutrient-binding outer membrane lipoprotein [Bacteroidales bacterium]